MSAGQDSTGRTFDFINEDIKNSPFPSNYVRSTKYTLITFLPLCLFYQFKRLANIYFLIIAIMQSIPAISPLTPISSIAPLIFVIAVSMIREAWEDFVRYRTDKATNLNKAQRYRRGEWATVHWKDLIVGDVIKICDMETIPADAIVIESADAKYQCFIMTSTLDGEKNLKPKFAPMEIQDCLASKTNDSSQEFKYQGTITCGSPDENLYSFSGSIIMNQISAGLTAKQLLLRGALLKNTPFVTAVVVYTGRDTKIIQNSGKSRFKQSRLEMVTNKFIIVTIGIEMLCCLTIFVGSWIWNYNYQDIYSQFIPTRHNAVTEAVLTFFTIFILLNTMIPISLIISVEMVKLFQAYFINIDMDMYDRAEDRYSRAFSSSLNEELGQIEYIFSDKTGTLTSNNLELRTLVIADQPFGDKHLLTDNEPTARQPKRRLTYVSKREGIEFSFEDTEFRGFIARQKDREIQPLVFKDSRGKHLHSFTNLCEVVDNFLLTISLCHDCLCETDNENVGQMRYQGMSPDEVVLVDAARHLKYAFRGVTNTGKLLHINDEEIEVEVIDFFEFDSDRKRSSIIIKHDDRYKLYVKGADSAILNALAKNVNQPYLEQTKTYLDKFSLDGLRTLCYAMKLISKEEMEELNQHLNLIKKSLDRTKLMSELAAKLESNLVLIGCSAVEDKLQSQVPEVIADFLQANIKVWMLTGDKLETAENIAYSCKLIQRDFQKVYLRTQDDLNHKLSEFSRTLSDKKPSDKFSLIVEGPVVLRLMRDINLSLRYTKEVFQLCDSVICCRMSPGWKGDIVQLIKNNLGKITLAIGDGANDVNMIQRADIGIGLYGKEGMRAVQSSDYGLVNFKCLWKLLFVHGRFNYIRISDMILYFIYKNVVFAIPQFLYCFYNGFSGQTIFDDYYITFYNLFFTSWPVILRAVFDQDIYYMKWTRDHGLSTKKKMLVEYPELKKYYPYLYYIGQKNKLFKYVNKFHQLYHMGNQCNNHWLLDLFLHSVCSVLRDSDSRRYGSRHLVCQPHSVHIRYFCRLIR